MALPPRRADTLTQGPPATFRERAEYKLRDFVGRNMAKKLTGAADFTPLGALFAGNEIGAAVNRGDNRDAIEQAAIAILGAVPGGRMAGKAAKAGGELAMDTASRMARAKKMGFTRDVYHGTNSDVAEFSRIDGGNMLGDAVYVAEQPSAASAYAMGDVNRMTPHGDAGPNVMPLKASLKQPFDITAPASEKDWRGIRKGLLAQGVSPADIKDVRNYLIETNARRRRGGEKGATNQDLYEAVAYMVPNANDELFNNAVKAGGFDAIRFPATMTGDGQSGHYLAIFDPKNLRSRSASFDPAKRNSANLMAGVAGGAVAVPLTLGQFQQQREAQR